MRGISDECSGLHCAVLPPCSVKLVRKLLIFFVRLCTPVYVLSFLFFTLSYFFGGQDKTTLSILEKLHGLLGIDRNDAEPHSVEARRRLAFFTNSLFMDMPRAPPVQARQEPCSCLPVSIYNT